MNIKPIVNTEHVSAVYRRNLSAGRARLADILGGQVEVASGGSWLTMSDGSRYLNAGGYGVFITGARHPTVVEEVERQLATHPVGTRIFLEPTAARAAELLTSVTPIELIRIHFSGSGAEATEAAIKIARLNGRKRLISMNGGYHGKTMGALSVTAKRVYQEPFEPLIPMVSHVPFGDVSELARALDNYPGEAGVIVEPVQGEAGVIIPPTGYLQSVRALCSEYGALLILDEIQTGLGRLGHWWGADRDNIRPDILLAGKSLGGGVVPVAATVTTEEVFSTLDRDPLLHTSTFSAAPLAMAAVCGAVRAIREDGLIDKAAALGDLLLPRIHEELSTHIPEHQWSVRGVGLLIALDFRDPLFAADMFSALVENNVIANLSLNSNNVIRLTPPAVMSDYDVDFLLERIGRAARLVAQRNPEV